MDGMDGRRQTTNVAGRTGRQGQTREAAAETAAAHADTIYQLQAVAPHKQQTMVAPCDTDNSPLQSDARDATRAATTSISMLSMFFFLMIRLPRISTPQADHADQQPDGRQTMAAPETATRPGADYHYSATLPGHSRSY